MSQLRKQKRQRDWQRIVFGGLFVALSLGIIGLLLSVNLKISQKKGVLTGQAEILGREFTEAKRRNEELKTDILQINTQDYLEKEARERMNLRKASEEVVVVLPLTKKSISSPGKVRNFWQNLLEIIGF